MWISTDIRSSSQHAHTDTRNVRAAAHTQTKEKCAHTFLLKKQHTNSRYPGHSETLTMKKTINSLVYIWFLGI
jgi:hypothetical protein